MVNMQYPYSNYNKNYDGKNHKISVNKLIELNNSDIYFLSYFDKNLKKNMVTFIKKQEDNFYNMPLDDYSNISIFLKKLQITDVNPSIINDDIKLGCITSIKVLYDYIKKYNKVKKHFKK